MYFTGGSWLRAAAHRKGSGKTDKTKHVGLVSTLDNTQQVDVLYLTGGKGREREKL